MARQKLDSIDRQILVELQNDGRMTNVELASRVGISAPPLISEAWTDAWPSAGWGGRASSSRCSMYDSFRGAERGREPRSSVAAGCVGSSTTASARWRVNQSLYPPA